MSKAPDSIKHDSEWGFKITKNEEHPVLFEFDTKKEKKRHSTPAFLMAILIKEHLKAIKEETGEKPDKIGFCLFDDFSYNDHKRAEAQLKLACDFLKIEVVFVNLQNPL